MPALAALAASLLLAQATIGQPPQINAKGWTHLIDQGNNIVFTRPGQTRDPLLPMIWMRMELIEPYVEDGGPYYALASLIEVDCPQVSARRISISAYTQHNLEGEMFDVEPNPGWKSALPGSIMYQVVNRACGREEQTLRPQSAA